MKSSSNYEKLITKVPSNSNGVLATMFHGMSGSPLFASRFGQEFKKRSQIAVVRGFGLVKGEDAFDDSDNISDAYLSSTKSAFSSLPTVFGGICIGGLIAIDVAHKAYLETGKSAKLILIDPPSPGAVWLKPNQIKIGIDTNKAKLKYQILAWRVFLNICKKLNLETSVLGRKARREVFKKSLTYAYSGFTAPDFPCDVLLISSSEWGAETADQYDEWLGAKSTLEKYVFEGRHKGFQNANHKKIDALISAFLDK